MHQRTNKKKVILFFTAQQQTTTNIHTTPITMSDFSIVKFHSLVFAVSNAKTAAAYFVTKFGFHDYAYRGLETNHRESSEHAISCNDIVFIFRSPLSTPFEGNDHVCTINLVTKGSTDAPPYMSKRVTLNFLPEEEAGSYFDAGYGWKRCDSADNKEKSIMMSVMDGIHPISLKFIDHVVSNYPEGDMEKICDWLEKSFNMHRFWSVDEDVIHTDYSSLRSVVMANPEENVLLPINEPAKGLRKSQIQEYLDFNGGNPGVQHIALRSTNILRDVQSLRARGIKFLTVPKEYYEDLENRLLLSKCVIKEDLKDLQNEGILVDFDDNGYLLQIFTEAIDYRPTVFFEIIQRNNHNGFGAGNFKSLFVALEKEQERRGNLTDIASS